MAAPRRTWTHDAPMRTASSYISGSRRSTERSMRRVRVRRPSGASRVGPPAAARPDSPHPAVRWNVTSYGDVVRPMPRLDLPPTHADLVTNPNTAVLTTVGPGGQPQSTAVWFLVDDDGVLKSSI